MSTEQYGVIDFLKRMDEFTSNIEQRIIRSSMEACLKQEEDGSFTYVSPKYLNDADKQMTGGGHSV